MRLTALAVTLTVALTGPAFAQSHSCGTQPTTPTHFDPVSASKDEILKLKAEFEAFKEANTRFIECLESSSKSSSVKRLIDTTVDTEQKFADAFNTNAKAWVKNQSRAGR